MKRAIKFAIVAAILFSFLAIAFVATASAQTTADDPEVSWYVTDSSNSPINGAAITIYYSTSASGPFAALPAANIYDEIANTNQNPIYTGYYNPDHAAGYAVSDITLTHISNYYFYVKVDYNGKIWYWPTQGSQNPSDTTWAPVAASGSPSGYAATGNGIGNGVSTAFPTTEPPSPPLPEAPWGALTLLIAATSAFGAYYGISKLRFKHW